MNILLIYHFFHPDKVVSAQIFSDLAEDLSSAGHKVTVFTSDHHFNGTLIAPNEEAFPAANVEICRFPRPTFRQNNNIGRLLNSFILQRKWLKAFAERHAEFDAVILGTDPQFGYMMLPTMRRLAPKCLLIHWALDLYPEAIEARWPWLKPITSLLRFLPRRAYSNADVIAHLGDCMKKRLEAYHSSAKLALLTPWALVEPDTFPTIDAQQRSEITGVSPESPTPVKLAFLYSGTIGHAHNILPFIQLARVCRKRNLGVHICFAGSGNCAAQQKAWITKEDTNISLGTYVPSNKLVARLASADFHLVSVQTGWEGVVAPSKFFAALAVGRPVIYSGPQNNCVAQWIREYDLGYVLDDNTVSDLEKLLAMPQQRMDERMAQLRQNAWKTYHNHFSRKIVFSHFQDILFEGLNK